MKLPALYSRRVLMRTKEFWDRGIEEEHIDRLKTPPYVSNTPQVLHHRLRRSPRRSSHPRQGSSRSHASSSTSHFQQGRGEEDVALLLCSDGLVDLYEDQDLEEEDYLRRWAAMIGQGLSASPSTPVASSSPSVAPVGSAATGRNGGHRNVAMQLLRDAIGGSDLSRVSANLTVEMDERWMDDTTILIHRFV